VKKRRYLIKCVDINKDTLAARNSELIRTLSKMKCLQAINIDFWGNIDLKPEAFTFLARALRPLKNLQACCLVNHDPDTISVKGASQVIQSLSFLRNLKRADFSFSDCLNNNINEDVMKCLIYKLTRLRRVQKFALDCSSCEALTNSSTKLLGKRMLRFAHLQNLKIDFSYCPSLGKEGVSDIVQKISLLRELTSLEMRFGGKRLISDDELTLMSKEIVKLCHLAQLSLTFDGYESIKEQGLNFLIECLNQLRNLSILELDLTGCKSIKDSELIKISENIAFFERLRRLKLHLFNTSISDIGMIKLSESFVRLPKIESLDLAFGGYEFIDNFGPPSLAQSLSGMKNLKALKIELTKTKISDGGLEKFIKGISKLAHLRKLGLKFCQSNELTGKGICALSEHMVKLAKLDDLELDFSHSSNITSDGVLNLTGNIWRLTKLQHVALKFQSCMKLSKAAQEALRIFDLDRPQN